MWCFWFFFHFLYSNVPDTKCHKQKWCVLFFTCINIVMRVLSCVRSITCIKWRRLIMYCLPKCMRHQPVGTRLIVGSKICSTTPRFDKISKLFTMIFNYLESFHRKNSFYTYFKTFWIVENSFPTVQEKSQNYFNFRLQYHIIYNNSS